MKLEFLSAGIQQDIKELDGVIPKEYLFHDSLFPSNNDLEIPTLRLDMQPETCAIPFILWGEQRRSFQMNNQGTLHFYTDDYRFNSVFEHPDKILFMEPLNIVEPNLSLYDETPIALGMQQSTRNAG